MVEQHACSKFETLSFISRHDGGNKNVATHNTQGGIDKAPFLSCESIFSNQAFDLIIDFYLDLQLKSLCYWHGGIIILQSKEVPDDINCIDHVQNMASIIGLLFLHLRTQVVRDRDMVFDQAEVPDQLRTIKID
jgi:hypothetical protein